MQNMMLAYSSKHYSVNGVDEVTICNSHIRNVPILDLPKIIGIHGNVCSGYHGNKPLEAMTNTLILHNLIVHCTITHGW